jgi:subtilisin family serine protease
VPVVVIDTGLAVNDRQDGWLAGLQDDHNADPLDVWPEENGYLDLAAGHGTFVAGLVQRVDPQLDLSVVKVVDSDGLADEVEVAVALVAAVEEHLAPGGKLVVNLSLGSETLDDLPPVALEVALEIVREIEAERGGEVLLVAAAGNDGSDVPCWPAAFAATDPRVVAVAALGADGSPAGWSTRGTWVTCSTEGEAVLSTYVTGTEDPDHQPEGEEPDTFGADAWAWWTGTSFAAPQVAAAVASQARTSGSSLADALGAVLARATGHHPDYGALLPPLV